MRHVIPGDIGRLRELGQAAQMQACELEIIEQAYQSFCTPARDGGDVALELALRHARQQPRGRPPGAARHTQLTPAMAGADDRKTKCGTRTQHSLPHPVVRSDSYP